MSRWDATKSRKLGQVVRVVASVMFHFRVDLIDCFWVTSSRLCFCPTVVIIGTESPTKQTFHGLVADCSFKTRVVFKRVPWGDKALGRGDGMF